MGNLKQVNDFKTTVECFLQDLDFKDYSSFIFKFCFHLFDFMFTWFMNGPFSKKSHIKILQTTAILEFKNTIFWRKFTQIWQWSNFLICEQFLVQNRNYPQILDLSGFHSIFIVREVHSDLTPAFFTQIWQFSE